MIAGKLNAEPLAATIAARIEGVGGIKAMTLRLDRELSDQLQIVADVSGKTVNEFVREAIAARIVGGAE